MFGRLVLWGYENYRAKEQGLAGECAIAIGNAHSPLFWSFMPHTEYYDRNDPFLQSDAIDALPF